MSTNGKVIWSEGMFLRPQHFQQQDRYTERLVRQRAEGLSPFSWGLRHITINRALLELGKFALDNCDGVFPDGTPFAIPSDLPHPAPLDLAIGLSGVIIYLCLPVQHPGTADIEVGSISASSARYSAREIDVADAISGSNGSVRLRTAELRLGLMLESDDRSGCHCLGIARIAGVAADRRVRLDPNYIPPVMAMAASDTLSDFVSEVHAMLHHRGEALAPRVTGSSSHGVAEIADFLLLQVINRAEPLLAHLGRLPALHPERLYATLLELAGDLATFTAQRKRPEDFAAYQHDDLEGVFAGLMQFLRDSFSVVMELSAVQIPLQERNYGILVGAVIDKTLLTTAGFVLAIKAAMPEEALRRSLPALIKIGPVEQIRELVNVQLPGVGIQPLAVAPRQLPYHSGAVYFELEPGSRIWNSLATSGGIAIHLSGDFPEVSMELWAIRR